MTDGTNKPALMRWLVAAPVGEHLHGKAITSSGAVSLPEQLKQYPLTLDVPVADSPHGTGARTVKVRIAKMSDFSMKSIVKSSDTLRALAELAGELKTRPNTLPKLMEHIGDGPLADAIAQAVAFHDAGEKKISVDDVLDTSNSTSGAARQAVDRFVRGVAQSERVTAEARKTARDVRDLVERAVYHTARTVLAAPEVAAAESMLRGLSFLQKHCSDKSGIRVELVHCTPDTVVETVQQAASNDADETFDAIFVPMPCKDVAQVTELARVGEALLCPLIVEAPVGLIDEDALSGSIERLSAESPQADSWREVCSDESTRWISVVVNRMVLKAEGGSEKRVVLGSSVWALAAQLATSYRLSGGFAYILGRPGGVHAPDVHMMGDTSVPTAAFASLKDQRALAELGVIALGSGRNDDKIIVARTPVVRGSDNAAPLPAQIVTGKIVRFSQWILDQLPNGADDEAIGSLFSEAAKVFLAPSIGERTLITAKRASDETIAVHAIADLGALGHAHEIGFELPG